VSIVNVVVPFSDLVLEHENVVGDAVLCENLAGRIGVDGVKRRRQKPSLWRDATARPPRLGAETQLRQALQMDSLARPFAFCVLLLSGWINRHQQDVIDYLLEKNRVLRAAHGARRIRLSDDPRICTRREARSMTKTV